MPAESTKQKALEILDNMKLIVKRGRLKHDEYVSDEVADRKLHETGAICDGRNYCMIGTLWVAGGVKPEIGWGIWGGLNATLESVSQPDRPAFLKHRPDLKLAYDALNEAAESRLRRSD